MTQEEEVLDITEQELKPIETSLEELEKEDLIRLLNQKDVVITNYTHLLNEARQAHKEIVELYNKDMDYLSTVNANLIKFNRYKEDAVKNIVSGALTLLTSDREVIAPERKENE